MILKVFFFILILLLRNRSRSRCGSRFFHRGGEKGRFLTGSDGEFRRFGFGCRGTARRCGSGGGRGTAPCGRKRSGVILLFFFSLIILICGRGKTGGDKFLPLGDVEPDKTACHKGKAHNGASHGTDQVAQDTLFKFTVAGGGEKLPDDTA